MTEKTPIEQYLLLSESKAVVVLLWLMKHRNSENFIFTTIEHISRECDVTRVTVNRVFQRLYKEGFLERVKNGQYRLLKI